MGIVLDENLLLGVAGAVFIPVFIFFVKLIIEVGNIKSKIDHLNEAIESNEPNMDKIREAESDIRILKLRVDNLEKHVNTINNNYNRRSQLFPKRDLRDNDDFFDSGMSSGNNNGDQ